MPLGLISLQDMTNMSTLGSHCRDAIAGVKIGIGLYVVLGGAVGEGVAAVQALI
jgi:hypothetical protein